MSSISPSVQNWFEKSSLRLGTQLFVNPEDSVETLIERIETLHCSGMRLLRLFLVWDQIEPRQGDFRWTPWQEIFDFAATLDMKIVGTLFPASPPGWMKLTEGIQEAANLDDPAFLSTGIAHLQTVVDRFKNHPALDSWILWNEPGRVPDPKQPATLGAFQTFLKERYRDIEAYNSCHYQSVRSFDEIGSFSTANASQAGFISHRSKTEWLEFSVANLQSKLELFAASVRSLDSQHPIHINPHRISQCHAEDGQSIWQQGNLVDFLGCSAHPAWHSVRFAREDYGLSIAMFSDLIRNASRGPNHYFWVTELQGGTTLLSGNEILASSPEESRLWLWESIASGAKAVIYWCANARTDGFEAGEWDLLDNRGLPGKRLQEITRTWERLGPHHALLASATPAPADVAILVSEESEILDLVQGFSDSPADPRNFQRGTDAVCGAYLLAAKNSLAVDFFDSSRFLEIPLEDMPSVILLPSHTVTSIPVLERLKEAAEKGALVIADGFLAWKDKSGRLDPKARQIADEIFGTDCLGYEGVSPEHIFSTDAGRIPAFFSRALLEAGDADLIASWNDQLPAGFLAPRGRGFACRLGTQFFQRYFVHHEEASNAWFKNLLSRKINFDLLSGLPKDLRLRRLKSPAGEITILINSSRNAASVQWGEGSIEILPQDAVILPPSPSSQ